MGQGPSIGRCHPIPVAEALATARRILTRTAGAAETEAFWTAISELAEWFAVLFSRSSRPPPGHTPEEIARLATEKFRQRLTAGTKPLRFLEDPQGDSVGPAARKLQSYVKKIVENTWRSRAKQENSRTKNEKNFKGWDPDPEKEVRAEIALRNVQELLKKVELAPLTERERQAFYLVAVARLGSGEVGRRLGISSDAVRGFLSRARKKIRKVMC